MRQVIREQPDWTRRMADFSDQAFAISAN